MKLDTLYLIHHSHTDVGYTADQPVFWELQARFIMDALDLVDRHRDGPPDSAFRWTVETACQLEAFLERAPDAEVRRFVEAERAGYVEATAMFANLTPLADAGQLDESFRLVERLRSRFGLTIRYAMNCDVNGHNWILPDALLDLGIEGFSMAVNQHFGGAPDPRPLLFRWEAPSGRLLPALNGWQYSKAGDFGLGDEDDSRFAEWLPRIEKRLEDNGMELPFFALQGMHPFGDNGSAWDGFARFAARWNASGRAPRLVCATPRMFWERARDHLGGLPALRGDWTDYWNFGCLSAARETTASRTARERLRRADASFSVLGELNRGLAADDASGERSRGAYARRRDEAWRQLNLYSEHTWGADESASNPDGEDTLAMESHKASFAWNARALSLLLERDGLAELARLAERDDPLDFFLFNPLPWPRTVGGPIARNYAIPRGLPEDAAASRHFLGRQSWPTDFWTGRDGNGFNGNMGLWLPPTPLPAFGWAVVPASGVEAMMGAERTDDAVVETARWSIRFDTERGGIASLIDRKTGREWVDAEAGLPFLGAVHEEVADRERAEPRKAIFDMDWSVSTREDRGWKAGWASPRDAAARVVEHAVYRLPFAWVAEQVLLHGRLGLVRERTVAYDDADHLEFEAEWTVAADPHPQASYLALPFRLPGAQARFDAGIPVRPELDQLPGVNRDYFTVQGWVDFNDGRDGILVATPENPMVQLGGFHFGDNQARFSLERALFLGWITNNYWETNFPVRQPKAVSARYAILPYEGAFDPGRAYRFAADRANARPVPQPLGESPRAAALPRTGSFLTLPEPPVMVRGMEPAADGMLLTLYNAGDGAAEARLAGGSLRLAAAWLIEADGRRTPLPSGAGSTSLRIEARRTARVLVETKFEPQGALP